MPLTLRPWFVHNRPRLPPFSSKGRKKCRYLISCQHICSGSQIFNIVTSIATKRVFRHAFSELGTTCFTLGNVDSSSQKKKLPVVTLNTLPSTWKITSFPALLNANRPNEVDSKHNIIGNGEPNNENTNI